MLLPDLSVRSNVPACSMTSPVGHAPLHVWPDYDDDDNGDICEVKKRCRLPAARQTNETSVTVCDISVSCMTLHTEPTLYEIFRRPRFFVNGMTAALLLAMSDDSA